jgi:phage terminase large subunit-like protein
VGLYAEQVLSGQIQACEWIQLAARRHLDDLAHGQERGLIWSPKRAQHILDFFQFLKHSKGEWAGQTIKLELWQQFILGLAFGWIREDGYRRFRTVFIEVARKNGKSTMGAGTGLYLLVGDGEPGAEVYTAATKRDQARITHSEATRMVKASPFLRKHLNIYKDNLSIPESASKYEPLGADSDTMDGLNVHAAIVDELHAHRNRGTWDVLDTATGARRQPMLFGITTAGFDRKSLCYELHEYTQKILKGSVVDDTFLGFIFTLDPQDNWQDESCWIKANPNLGVSKKIEDMRAKANQAREMPTKQFAFMRLELNIWTQSVTKWIPWDHWQKCDHAVNEDGLAGRICYGGLDLSSNIDISAEVLVFPPQLEGEPYLILCRFWIPEESMQERSKKDRVPYDAWVRQGYITATPGNVIDYEFILDQIQKDYKTFDFRELAYDRWGATKIATDLMDLYGEDFLVQFGQGYASMSGPTKDLERLILQHTLGHGNNPVLNWMADNLVVRRDPAENIKPDKEASTERIDGMVALIMALARAMVHGESGSVYDDRGIRTL